MVWFINFENGFNKRKANVVFGLVSVVLRRLKYNNLLFMKGLFNFKCIFACLLSLHIHGPKAAGQGKRKSALRITKKPLLREIPWPNGWS